MIDRNAPLTVDTLVKLVVALYTQTPQPYTARERRIERHWQQHLHWLAGVSQEELLNDNARSQFMADYRSGRIRMRRKPGGN